MIINKLEMFNFRQYVGHQTVTFSTDKHKNVTVLVGINTSGKTTLVRAFEWCLYGKKKDVHGKSCVRPFYFVISI